MISMKTLFYLAMVIVIPLSGKPSIPSASNAVTFPPVFYACSDPVTYPPIQYNIQTVKATGNVSLAGEHTSVNSLFIGRLPVAFNTGKNSLASFLLPNNSGMFMLENTTIIINEIKLKIPSEKNSKKICVIYMELLAGSFSMCLPETTLEDNRIELTIRNLKLIVSNNTNFLILNNIIYVTRGSIDLDGYAINENQFACISSNQPIVTNKIGTKELIEISDPLSEACFAKFFIPSLSAEPAEENIQFKFPVQKTNPNIVSPAS